MSCIVLTVTALLIPSGGSGPIIGIRSLPSKSIHPLIAISTFGTVIYFKVTSFSAARVSLCWYSLISLDLVIILMIPVNASYRGLRLRIQAILSDVKSLPISRIGFVITLVIPLCPYATSTHMSFNSICTLQASQILLSSCEQE